MIVKHIPEILKVMAPFPNHLVNTATIEQAHKLAHAQNADFVVAVDEHGEPLGVVYREFIDSIAGLHPDWRIDMIMSKRFTLVDAHDAFDRVLETLANQKLPLALIMHKGKLAGSFCYSDCARLLKQAIHNKPITSEPPNITA
jgi:predicted transcriptional regulator